jgi:hypothetical protein
MKAIKLMKNNLFTLLLASATLALTVSLSPTSAKAENANSATNNSSNNSFLQQVREQLQQAKQSIQQPIQNLTNDINQGIESLSTEIQFQINSAIGKSVGALGIPDIVKAGGNIKDIITSQPTDLLQVNTHIQGKNAEQSFHQQYTTAQSGEVLGAEGQQKMKHEAEVTQNATDIALRSGENAQSDIVTQDIMKKLALQNAQTVTVLQSVQTSLQEQNKLTATANVNLSDISQNLSIAQHRKQNEEQGITNAIYRNAALADGFWRSKHESNNP